MLRFLADENSDNRILHAMLQENTGIDVLRVQDLEIYQADDPVVLEWAAQHGRVILTRDVSTLSNYAYARSSREAHAGCDSDSQRSIHQDDGCGYTHTGGRISAERT